MTASLAFASPELRVGGFTLAPGVVRPAAGRVTVLIGVNGSGKSTALRAAAGLLAPSSGGVLVDGRPVHAMSAAGRAARVAMVPQRHEVGSPFTAREVVRLGKVATGGDEAAVDRAMAAARVSALADRPFHALSGGQQQRVVLARALAQHAPGGILLLDEAFAAVDPAEAAEAVRTVREAAAAGATVLAATHDLALASALADDAWLLADGRTWSFGPATELLSRERLSAFLGIAIAAAPGQRGAIAAADYAAMLRGP